MIVYLYPNKSQYAGRTFGRHIGLDVRHVQLPEFVEPADVAEVFVESLDEDERAAANGSVDALVIVADGGPGWIKLSGGQNDEQLVIDEHNALDFASRFARFLKSARDGGEGVEIHACSPAAPLLNEITGEIEDEKVGVDFLAVLAAAFGQRVVASADPHVNGIDEDFEDSRVEAEPVDAGEAEVTVRVIRDVNFDRGSPVLSRVEAAHVQTETLLSGAERA